MVRQKEVRRLLLLRCLPPHDPFLLHHPHFTIPLLVRKFRSLSFLAFFSKIDPHLKKGNQTMVDTAVIIVTPVVLIVDIIKASNSSIYLYPISLFYLIQVEDRSDNVSKCWFIGASELLLPYPYILVLATRSGGLK